MNKNRIILYAAFAIFHLGAFVFTVILDMNKEDIGVLLKMAKWLPMFKWITFLGVIILVIDVAWAFKANKDATKEKTALTLELNTLKAKLFDLQEDAKKQSAAKTTDRS